MADKKVKQEASVDKKAKGAPSKAGQQSERYDATQDTKIPSRLLNVYRKEVVPALMTKFGYKSIMQVPEITKIVINMGLGDAVSEPKLIEDAVKDLEAISGQRPSIRKSKKAISNFKLREGMNIGAMVTLRRERMYEFLDRLINISLPRVRDFKGLPDKSFDGRGSYSFGVKEQIIYPEINVDKITKILGMDVTIVTTAKTDAEAYELLIAFGFPFRKKEVK